MTDSVETTLGFLDRLRAQNRKTFPGMDADKVISFMGTTASRGTHLDVSVARVLSLDVTSSDREIEVTVEGKLPHAPEIGERVTVSVVNLARFRGYQIKTQARRLKVEPDSLAETTHRGSTLVHGRHVYTVHHSPYVLNVFEKIPREQVIEDVGSTKYAVVGVGEEANISPRFIFHYEALDGQLFLYHGDGYAHKTYLNVLKNQREARVVVDPQSFEGYVFRGVVEEIDLASPSPAHEKIKRGFEAGGWGVPSRIFCLTADSWEPISA